MNERCRKIFDTLKVEITDLHLRWVIYRQLYASSNEAVELLNASGSNVFYLLQFLLLDDCALKLSKLTDPPTQGKFENLSVHQLVNAIVDSDGAFPRAEMEGILKTLNARCEGFRTIRNKRIAHADLNHALRVVEEPLLGISREDVELALETVREAINCIESHYFQSETLYQEVIIPYSGDGNKLLAILRAGNQKTAAH